MQCNIPGGSYGRKWSDSQELKALFYSAGVALGSGIWGSYFICVIPVYCFLSLLFAMHTQVYIFFFIAEMIYVNFKHLKKFSMYENH